MATDSPYWNPKTETLDRERIEALQLAKLRRHCAWAAARSRWYRRRFASDGFDPQQLRSLADLRRIPVLTREDWMASQEAQPPYGEIPVIGGEDAIRRAPALRAKGQADDRPARDAGGGGQLSAVDLLGSELSPTEQRLLAVYEELKALCAEDLPPNAHAGVRASLALMHNVVSGLALEYEHLTDLGA